MFRFASPNTTLKWWLPLSKSLKYDKALFLPFFRDRLYVKTDVNCTKQHFYLCVQEADVNTRSSLTKAPVQMNLFP